MRFKSIEEDERDLHFDYDDIESEDKYLQELIEYAEEKTHQDILSRDLWVDMYCSLKYIKELLTNLSQELNSYSKLRGTHNEFESDADKIRHIINLSLEAKMFFELYGYDLITDEDLGENVIFVKYLTNPECIMDFLKRKAPNYSCKMELGLLTEDEYVAIYGYEKETKERLKEKLQGGSVI